MLYDADSEMYLRHLASACDLGIPAMTYAIGAGPLVDQGVRMRIRDVLNRAQLVTVRDRYARQLLEDLGVDRGIHLTVDPALLLKSEPLTLDEYGSPARRHPTCRWSTTPTGRQRGRLHG